MASIFNLSITLLLLITAITTVTVTAVPEHEYSSLLSALRNRGYHVFANAITTTDLYYDIISGGNFTFFAPIDSVLFTLDMSMSAADYTTTMRLHVVPQRLSFSDLRQLPYGLTSFPTLLTDHEIHVVNPLALPLPIIVEGVYISVPDLYYDTHIVVHGLESIIDSRSKNDTVNSTSIDAILSPDLSPTDVHRETYVPSPHGEAHAPSPLHETHAPSPLHETHAPSPLHETHPPSPHISDPVTALPPKSFAVSGVHTVASPTPVPVPQTSYVPSSGVTESIVQSNKSPETRSESIVQSVQSPEVGSDSIVQSHKSPEIKSETIVQPHKLPETYSESITQPLEEHATIATKSRFIPQAIHHVSLATKSTDNALNEFTPVDETVIDCPVADDEREQMSIANIRRGDHYVRELYNPTEMTCAHDKMESSGNMLTGI